MSRYDPPIRDSVELGIYGAGARDVLRHRAGGVGGDEMTNALLALLLALGIISTPDMVREMAVREGVSPELANCIVRYESNGDPHLIGDAGEIGLMQIMPDTGKWAATKVGLESYDLHDPVHNLTIGLWILREYPEFFHTLFLCEE